MAKPHINVVFIGHVDHGKSTTVGRLLYETGVISEQIIEKYKKEAETLGKQTFEFAFVLDASKEERSRGLTIDLAHRKFETEKYTFTIIDAPGHKDFIKNMITGTSQADAAVLVVSGKDGVQPQTKEHAYLAKVLGVKQMIVSINKMDAVNYDQSKFNEVKDQVSKLLQTIGYKVDQVPFIPTSAYKGDNITKKSENMSWYDGPTLLEALNNLNPPEQPIDLPLRVPIQDVYTIQGIGTVPVGRVETGVLKVGDKVVFEPSHKTGEVKSIEEHHQSIPEAKPGDNVGFNVRGIERKDIRRGDLMGHVDSPPTVPKKFEAQLIVLNHPTAIAVGYTPVLHAHTAQVPAKIVEIKSKLDPKTGGVAEENPKSIKAGDAAVVVIEPQKPLAIEEKGKIPQLASFVLRDMA